jgi:hypothetical protein
MSHQRFAARSVPDPAAAADPPSVVRQQVLEQHQALRELFDRLLLVAERTLQGVGAADLPGLLAELDTRFRTHLAFEEAKLAPVLAQVDVWGPQRVQQLLAEHTRQRGELETLSAGVASGWDRERLAVALRSLVTELLADMAEEERGCLSAEVLRDDVINIDQATD